MFNKVLGVKPGYKYGIFIKLGGTYGNCLNEMLYLINRALW